jgi:hypothetical protein
MEGWPSPHPRHVQGVLATPPRLKLSMAIWQRDDDPHTVMLSVDAVDGNGELLAMQRWAAPRTVEWDEALSQLRSVAAALFYELNSPF